MVGTSRPSFRLSASHLLLVYDSGCGFCRRCVRYLCERDLALAIQPIPNRSPGIEDRTGLTREQLDRSVWVIDEGGAARSSGAHAVNRALRALGGPWWVLGAAGSLPAVIRLEQVAYDWVAGHRTLASRLISDPPGPY